MKEGFSAGAFLGEGFHERDLGEGCFTGKPEG